MADQAAYIRLSLRDSTFEIKGSETFVAAQAERFEKLMHELLSASPVDLPPQKQPDETPVHEEHSGAPETRFPNVFAKAGDGFQILARVPGKTSAEKTANLALLLVFAETIRGGTSVAASIVQQAAKDHACLDSSNFKSRLKGRKSDFVLEGGSQTYEIKLTQPGREKAETLAKELELEVTGLREILSDAYPKELTALVLDAFEEIQAAFQARRWKASELDAGHFVEAVRRVIEFEQTSGFTPIKSKLPNFSISVLQKYENGGGHDSFRMLIPRVLWTMFALRNKRGVAHVGEVSPNELDATTLARLSKWVVGEIVRLKSGLTADETEALLHRIVQRECPVIWTVDGRDRVLAGSLTASEKILVLLFSRSPRSVEDLRGSAEYSNKTRFKSILNELHKKKLLDVGADAQCRISPLGETVAESLLHD